METNTTTTTPEATKPVRKPKLVKKAKPAAKPAKAKLAKGKIALKTICATLKVDPKAARRKLRKSELAFHASRDRWQFTEAQAERVRELLRPN